MKLDDEIRIEAPRDEVFAALNDPDILRRSIPGCEELEKISDTQFTAVVRAKVGPVRARFRGEVTLSDLNPPHGYTLSGQGKGGAAGFARGQAAIELREEGGATILKYDVTARVGGKLAQLGGRLIDNAARSLAGEFFKNFRKVVGGESDDDADGAEELAS
ncbi:MAG TPA: carbon monoxide dehydrogenase [Rhizobiales bacterium]|nr:carbon monoxide dehydrogenase [Hyphomicrobiales bacterium]